MNERARSLLAKLEARRATVGVVGLGYVGLPLALIFCERGLRVLGFDVDQEKVAALERGESYIAHIDAERTRRAAAEGRLEATADLSRLDEPDAIVICVPTPLTGDQEPDLRYVLGTAERIRDRLRPGQLVVLESTTYPGTTAEKLRPLLDESGLEAGEEYFLAYSPEREDPGNPDFGTSSIPKVVGADDAASRALAIALYSQIVAETVPVSSSRAAEASKLTENVFRAVNIALVNELKIVYEAMGIDVWEVLDAAATKPFGFTRFDPGPGWGGHCIPIDPFYLSWKARSYGIEPRFIELAGQVNVRMPGYVLERLSAALEERGSQLDGARVLVLGLAYKKNVADPRESPAFEILSRLLAAGAVVSYHDPHIPRTPSMRTWDELPRLDSVALDAATLEALDAVVIVTDHAAVDYELVARHAPLVVDTRGVYRQPADNVVKA